jgi:hypothetical protein
LSDGSVQTLNKTKLQAMKAALKGKRKADKDREALINAEGLDSIATISEQLEAEAKEAESESSNKDAEK